MKTTYKCQDCRDGPCYYTVTFKDPEPPEVCGYAEDEGVQLVIWEAETGRGRKKK